ncbi:hypothetical protein ACQY0O_001671 [Thecaphora frezii]
MSSVRPKSTGPRASTSAQSIKAALQDRLLDQLLAAFRSDNAPSPHAAEKARLQSALKDQVWSPADRWEVDRYLQGLSRRHAIDLSYELSAALQKTYQQLKLSAKQSLHLAQKARELHLIHQRQQQQRSGDSYRHAFASSDKGKSREYDDAILQDPPITPENVADMVQLLIALSRPADVTTSTYAHLLLDPDRPQKTTYLDPKQRQAAERAEWNRILLEEPLDGEEWRSGSSDTSELSIWTESSHQSDRRASASEDEYELYPIAVDSTRPSHPAAVETGATQEADWRTLHDHRARALEEAGLRRGWVVEASQRFDEFSDVVVVREAILALQGYAGLLFELGSATEMRLRPSVFGSDDASSAARRAQFQPIASISSTLLKLQSFAELHGVVLDRSPDSHKASTSLEAFAEQVVVMLERVKTWFSQYDCDLAAGLTATTSAFAIRSRDATLSILLADVERETRSLRCIAELLSDLGMLETPMEARSVDADCTLLDALQATLAFDLAGGGSEESAMLRQDLSCCFVAMAQPWWRQVCRSIREGVSFAEAGSGPSDESTRTESMFARDPRVSPLGARFWTDGYRLRGKADGGAGEAIPAFIAPFASDLLDGCKSVGLLRALGVDVGGSLEPCEDLRAVLEGRGVADIGSDDGDDDSILEENRGLAEAATVSERPATRSVTRSEAAAAVHAALFRGARATTGLPQPAATSRRAGQHLRAPLGPKAMPPGSPPNLADLSPCGSLIRGSAEPIKALLEPRLSQTLSRHLQPMLTVVRRHLHDALVLQWYEGGCDLYSHLSAIQGLYLMTRGPEMSEWCDMVFERLDSSQGEAGLDFHYLNSSFRDAMTSHGHDANEGAGSWIDTGLVRIYAGEPLQSRSQGVGQLSQITVRYQVPWPACYCFTPAALATYQEIFVLLLQVQRARKVVASLLKASHRQQHQHLHMPSMRKFWSLRKKVDWLVRVVGEYLIRDVIEPSAKQLRSDMDELVTFDSLIDCHGKAVERMRYLCFLQADQENLHDSILEALELAIAVSRAYQETFGEASLAASIDAATKGKGRTGARRRARRGHRKGRRRHEFSDDDDNDDNDDNDDEEDAEALDHGDGKVGGAPRTTEAAAPTKGNQSSVDIESSLSSSFDASRSWIDDVETAHYVFSRKVDGLNETLRLLLERLRTCVDGQIGRLAVGAAVHSREVSNADEAIRQMHEARERFQELLYAVHEGR